MDKVTNAELGQIKRRILEKVGPASNKVQITDLNAVNYTASKMYMLPSILREKQYNLYYYKCIKENLL